VSSSFASTAQNEMLPPGERVLLEHYSD